MKRKYIRDNLEDDYGILDLQDKILEIMVYIDKICNEHNINYSLNGGSALGAVRHGGFIPWDDDLDIYMSIDNYEKFRDIFNANGDKKKYYLQEFSKTSSGYITMAKVRMNNTTYIESTFKNCDMHQGIYVDIFILQNCPKKKHEKFILNLVSKYVIIKRLSDNNYTRDRGIIYNNLIKILSKLPKKLMFDFCLKKIYSYRYTNPKQYCYYMQSKSIKSGTYDSSLFNEYVYIPFEKIHLKCTINVKKYLELEFGDYMKLPSNDEIKEDVHAEIWDVNKDYREFVKNINNFSYENIL